MCNRNVQSKIDAILNSFIEELISTFPERVSNSIVALHTLHAGSFSIPYTDAIQEQTIAALKNS